MSDSMPPADWEGTQADWDDQTERNREAADEEQRRRAEQDAADAQAHADEMARDAEARAEADREAEERERILSQDGDNIPEDWRRDHQPHVMLTSEGHGSSEEDYRTP